MRFYAITLFCVLIPLALRALWGMPSAHAQAIPVSRVIYCTGTIEVWTHADGTIAARCGLHQHPRVYPQGSRAATEVLLHDPMIPERDAHGRIVPDSFVGCSVQYLNE